MLPYWSTAVIVRLSPAPATGVPVVAESLRAVADAPGLTVTLSVLLDSVGDVAEAVMLEDAAL